MKFVYILFFLLNTILFSLAKAETKKAVSPSKEQTLVLQWKVSHPRNTDQISLIFRQKSVELVTNTSSYQRGQVARLGRFQSSISPELKTLKEQIERYYTQLKKTIPISLLIKDSRFQASVDPHAPVLHINEEEIQTGQIYFKPLANIIYKVWEKKWICVECALYKQNKKSILRVVKNLKSEPKGKSADKSKNKINKQWETRKQIFSRKGLNCVPKGKNKVECVDPQFGIFEI